MTISEHCAVSKRFHFASFARRYGYKHSMTRMCIFLVAVCLLALPPQAVAAADPVAQLESEIKHGVPQKYDHWNESDLSFVQVDALTRVPIVPHGDKYVSARHKILRSHSQALETLARRGVFAVNAIKTRPVSSIPSDLIWKPLTRSKAPPAVAKIGLPIAMIVGDRKCTGDLEMITTPDLRFYRAGSTVPFLISWPHYVEMEVSTNDFPERGAQWAFDTKSQTLFVRSKEFGTLSTPRTVTVQIDPASGLVIAEWFDR